MFRKLVRMLLLKLSCLNKDHFQDLVYLSVTYCLWQLHVEVLVVIWQHGVALVGGNVGV